MTEATPMLAFNGILLALAVIVALGIIHVRNLIAMAVLVGTYSLTMALVWINMGAMDVAYAEAAVGSGISTIILLGALAFVRQEEAVSRRSLMGVLLALATGAVLIYGTFDMPAFGDANAPLHQLRAHHYRALDTLFETVVFFAAGIAIILLLRREKKSTVERRVP